VPIGHSGVGCNGVRDRPVGEIAIVSQAARTLLCPHCVFIQGQTGDLLQNGCQLLDFGLAEACHGSADPTVVGPARLPPVFGYRLILVNRMGRPANVLQVLQPGQDGNQEFQYFRLQAVLHDFLVQRNRVDWVDQADAL